MALLRTLAEVAAEEDLALNTLRKMLEESPPDLPGRPIKIGAGRSTGGESKKRREHVRWLASDVPVWFAAYAAWQRGETHRPARRPRR